ncbi:MAG: FAD-binding oxidoreductase [Chloroflexi bacterium]|nr:FAD-binding oxidoreductase [Chloroflexota bacterium]MBP8058858.1 FAD-binding oxidoreductase [Chloroflexota bacterium]
MPDTHFDVILVGGGVMGCAIATYLLRANNHLKIALVEMDPTYTRASTPLSDGNTRVQFNIKENIQMSQYALTVLATFAEEMAVNGEKPDIAFRQQGNLFLIDSASQEETLEGLARQQSLGCQVEWLTPDDIQQQYPFLHVPEYVGATLGRQDGTMSPLAVLLAYKNKAIALGAQFIQAEVAELLYEKQQITGVRLVNGEQLLGPAVVNTAGAWGTKLAQTAGILLPMQPIKRQVTVVETSVRRDGILPCLFFPSGLYCIHEGAGLFMVGKSFPDDPVTLDDFGWERGRFEELLWPELVEYMPAFDRLKIKQGWAGLYEVNTLDGNAILGEWPEMGGFYLANGFSGHGFQQCHAVGRYLSELILGQTPTLDLSIFSPRRILENQPVFESRRKII